MIRAFVERDGLPGAVVLELGSLHCQRRMEVPASPSAGPRGQRYAMWHGEVVVHDVDLLPSDGLTLQIVDDTGREAVVFVGCTVAEFRAEHLPAAEANYASAKRPAPLILLAVSYVRCMSYRVWAAEQASVSL